jgi:hypothetical protein
MPRGRHSATRFPLAVFVVLCVAVASCLAGARAAPFASERETRGKGSSVAVPPPVAAATPLPEPSGPSFVPLLDPSESPSPTETANPDPTAYRGLTAIGDSIMVDATPNLRARFPGLTIDAVAGRQVAVGIQAMLTLAWAGRLGDTVVIALGTNGPFSTSQFARIVALAGGRRMVMLTNYCPYCSWVPANNALIRSGCRQVPGCTVAEWQELAAANPGWFYADGVHMPIGGQGGQAYADLIAQMLQRPPATRPHGAS